MAFISISIATRSFQNACDEGEWFCYASVGCIEQDNHIGEEDSYREGDDDDDGGYDYAPAA
ncbi:hypothetical protein MtrunA17_Chr4g0012011 [Medicago truncatula]|uniref:Uncharacterized protein n=1 Tax=Medicago truncatula TaxID=3880 RepID=G7JFW3_MEDTR|nr:hypothetical protein MTR_4g026380 [Medicago truncatula]RHN59323.1 hypothetical protein MtrunA17_Chr4g0012011 [Medicago truncatula]